jgi:hypothetical protein
LVALLGAAALLAQLNRGSITGVLTDPTGAVIPGAKISIKNMATGAVYEIESNAAGQYTMPNLPTGPYQITFEAPSFKKLVRDGVTLSATEVLRVDATLEVGSVSESVQVTAEVPRLQTETPEVAGTLSNRQLIDLPLGFGGARLAENFAYKVIPGVSGGSWTSYIHGSTAFSKESLLDGATVTTYLSGHFGESSVSVEALEEFKIQTSGMSAEFGRTQAGIFNYVMRSGANTLHGSAYGALRNEALNANTFVNKARGVKRAQDRKQNYAGSFGGPIYLPKVYDGRNRTFFYTTYERYRERTGGFRAPDRTVPLPEFYEGDFSRLLGPPTGQTDAMGRPVLRGAIYDPTSFRQLTSGRWIGEPFPGNRIPVSRFSQVSRRLNDIARKSYLPTVRDASGEIPLVNNATFPLAGTPEFDQYQFSTKGDQIINERHKLSGSYSYIARPRLLLDQGGMWDPNDPEGGPLSKARRQRIKSSLARLAHDWTITPTVLNHFTLYWNRMANPNVGAHRNIDGAKELGIRNLSTYGFPQINWGAGPFISLAQPGDPQNDFQVYTGWGFLNTFSFSKGRHFLKAGFDLRRNHLSTRPTQGGSFNFAARGTAIPNEPFSGNLTGYSFASYLLGIVDSAGLGDPVGLGGRRTYYSLFFQDDFKVSHKLTLNIGIRWEYQPPFTEVGDRISSWNPLKRDPVSGLPGAYDFAGDCNGCTGQRYFGNRSLRDWGPRIGFAYRPWEKWTIRGAYGIFYEGDLFNGFSGTPLGKATSVAWGGTWQLSADPVNPWAGIFNWDNGFPTDRFVPASFDVSWGNRNRPGMTDPNYGRNPYSQSWNLNIQRELIKNLVVDIGYVGNKATGLRIGQLQLLNQLPPSVLSQYGRNLNNAVRNPAEAATNRIAYPFAGFAGTVASALRPYPQVQGNQTINVYGAPLGFSNYHALEVVVNRQFSKGLTVYTNYVWSKTMANMETSMVGSTSGRPLDYYNLSLEKAVSEHDIPHMFKAYVNYDLPYVTGQGLWRKALGGWSVSAILNYFSGTPLGFGGSFPLSGGWNGATNRANIAAGDMKVSGFDKNKFELSTLGSPNNTYLNKSLFSDPAPLTLGSAAFRYTQARNFGTISEDFGLQKNHRFAEKYRVQLRAEFLNFFNRHSVGGINTSITSPLFGQVTSVGGSRVIQLGARLDF